MSWFDGDVTQTEVGVAGGLLTNIRFDPEDPDSFFNWHETRGISRADLEAIYRNPRSKVRHLEKLYRKAGINIRDLRDLLDEAPDSETLESVFATNKRRFAPKGKRHRGWFLTKAAFTTIAFGGGFFLIILPFLKSCG